MNQKIKIILGIIMLALMINTISAEDGLVAYWSFDNITGNTAPDEAGNNDGTIYGAKVVDGISGKALEFDGIDDYINTALNPQNQLGQTFSFEAWVYPFTANNYRGVGGAHIGSYRGTAFLQYQDTGWNCGYGDGSSWSKVALANLTLNAWNHVVCIYKWRESVKIYVNGNLTVDVPQTIAIAHYSQFWMGRANDDYYSRYFNGTIDEVKIYNRALTAEEIKAEYDKINKPECKWWNCSWQYRKEINIEENSGKDLVDYPVNFTFDVSNISVKEDCSDLRFIDSYKELSYWIESCNNSKAKVWVRVNLTANEKKIIQMYYGNLQAESKSNGDNVFEFFDDFEYASFSKWDRVDQIGDKGWFIDSFIKYQGDYSAKGWDSDTSSDPWRSYALVKNFTSTSFVYELNVRTAENNRWHYPFLLHMKDGKDAYTIQAGPWGHWTYLSSRGYSNFPNDKQYSSNTWYKLKIKINESRYWVWVNEDMLTTEEGVDLVSWGDLQKVKSIQSINLLPGCGDSGEGFDGKMWIDNLFIYNYVSTEPKIFIETEEQNSCKTIEPWWNCSWQYRKEINIEENSGKDLVDYPVNFTFDVSNISVKEDCSDLRFIDSYKELSYWIESCNNSKATAWVKVNLTANEKKIIYEYYGNENANSNSNGSAVFDFFDTIENKDNWNFWGVPKAYADNSVGNPPPSIKANGNGWFHSGALSSKGFNYSTGLCLRLESKVTDTNSLRGNHIGFSNSNDYWNWNDNADWAVDGENAYLGIYGGSGKHERVYGINGRWISDHHLTLYNQTKPVNNSLWNSAEWGNTQCTDEYYDNDWHTYEICVLQNGTVKFYADGILKCVSNDTINFDGRKHNIIITGHDPEYWYDNFIVRKYFPPREDYQINLNSGWNLISIPLQTENSSIEYVLGPIEGKYTSVYTWDASSVNSWVYKTFLYGSWQGDLNKIEPKKGYWIKMNESANLTVQGGIIENTSILLMQGWNLIGWPSLNPKKIEEISMDGKYTSVYTWDASSVNGWVYKTFLYGSWWGGLESLEAGKGYWIKINESGNIVF